MTWENYLFAGAVIAIGLLFAGMALIEWLCKDQLKRSRRKEWLIPLACVLALSRAHASGPKTDPMVTVTEVDLSGFESHAEKLLDFSKPLYRVGEILRLNKTENYVVATDYHFEHGQWYYKIVNVKVGNK